MVIDLVKTMTPGEGSGSPTLRSEGYVRKLDEKHFRRVPVFDNRNPWREWRTHFLTAVRESYPELVDCLIPVESHEDPIPPGANLKEFQDTWTISPILHTRLMTMVKDVLQKAMV